MDLEGSNQDVHLSDEFTVDDDDLDENVIEVEVEQSGVNCSKPLKKTLKSKVWKFFDVLPMGADGKVRSACKKCGQQYLASSKYGTGNMSRHLKACKRRDTRDIGQMIISRDSGTLSTDTCKFDSAKWRELVASCVIMHDLPFQFVEYKGVRAMLQYLYPDVELVSRNTVKADCLKMHQREKTKIKNMVTSCPGRISLTSDLWSSLTTDGYLCLTAHFIDKNWKLQKRVLNFCNMPPPHNGIALSEKIYSLLHDDWGIEGKIFTITLDNATSNDVSVDSLQMQLNLDGLLPLRGEFFHLRCCAHILNLVVQDGLKKIDYSVEKIRDTVKYVKASQMRRQKFLECVKLVRLDTKKGLSQDVVTRWNSTYLMLERAIFFQRAFQHLQLSDSNYKFHLSADEWKRVEKTNKFLKVFYDATLVFSGTRYTTANLYFPKIIHCYTTLKGALAGEDEYLKNMASQMWEKFQKYWSDFSPILSIALVFDPRYKMQVIDYCYKKAYGENSVQLASMKNKLELLFEEYKVKWEEGGANASASPSISRKERRSNLVGTMDVDHEDDLLKVIASL